MDTGSAEARVYSSAAGDALCHRHAKRVESAQRSIVRRNDKRPARYVKRRLIGRVRPDVCIRPLADLHGKVAQFSNCGTGAFKIAAHQLQQNCTRLIGSA